MVRGDLRRRLLGDRDGGKRAEQGAAAACAGAPRESQKLQGADYRHPVMEVHQIRIAPPRGDRAIILTCKRQGSPRRAALTLVLG